VEQHERLLINLVIDLPSGSGSLLVMEMSFKRGQTRRDKERSESAKERDLAPSQNRIDTHPASPEVSQTHQVSRFCPLGGQFALNHEQHSY
jgi:hypothetical protein